MAFNLNRFDLTTLRLFVPAVDAGSLPAVAARVGLSLAAASKRVAELESRIGTPLLERSKRGVVRGAAELAVIGENTAAEGLQTVVCDEDELVLLLPPGHALAPAPAGGASALADLLEHDLVAFSRSTSLTRPLALAAKSDAAVGPAHPAPAAAGHARAGHAVAGGPGAGRHGRAAAGLSRAGMPDTCALGPNEDAPRAIPQLRPRKPRHAPGP